MAKFLVTTGSRRLFVKGAGAALGTLLLAGRRPARAAGDYESYVTAYYQAIAAHRYKTAYALLDAPLQANQPYDEFVAGFADTDYVELVEIGNGPGPSSATRFPLTVRVVAWHTDGTIHGYRGTYYVGLVGGTPKIVDADLTEETTPPSFPPLCRAADLGTTFRGDSATGSRYLTITFTNKGSAPCTLGGFPRVQVRDAGNARVISASEEKGVSTHGIRLTGTQQATLDLRWTNWCADEPSGPLSTLVTLPGHLGHLTVAAAPGVPPCLGSGASHLTEKPFAPA